jgi:hypothetical protein
MLTEMEGIPFSVMKISFFVEKKKKKKKKRKRLRAVRGYRSL